MLKVGNFDGTNFQTLTSTNIMVAQKKLNANYYHLKVGFHSIDIVRLVSFLFEKPVLKCDTREWD